MNATHTPGPWAIETCNENGPFLDSFYLTADVETWDGNNDERIVCRFPTGTGQFSNIGRENLANANLIATAPDMLDALQRIESSLEHEPKIYADILSVARAAIAKATGKQ